MYKLKKCIIFLTIFSFIVQINLSAEVKQAQVAGFTLLEVSGGLELNVQVNNCLKYAKLSAIVTHRTTKKSETFLIPRNYYDVETLEAVFSGIIPYKKNEVKIVIKISNYAEADLMIDDNDDFLSDMLERAQAEKEFNKKEAEFQEEVTIAKKRQAKKEQESEQAAVEAVVVVVVLLPTIMEQINSSIAMEDFDDDDEDEEEDE